MYTCIRFFDIPILSTCIANMTFHVDPSICYCTIVCITKNTLQLNRVIWYINP